MRLLNIHDHRLQFFRPASLPKYAITSHRWTESEPFMRDVREGLDLTKSGHRKLQGFIDYVKNRIKGIEWIWMDTCCINQDSSQEVTQAINSMFKWYRNAEVCLAYMADVDNLDNFDKSVWFTRGWTLQELVAPGLVVFLSGDWHVLGRKGGQSTVHDNGDVHLSTGASLQASISAVTHIPEDVLDDYAASQRLTVEEKSQWITGRETTMEEDLVYCLLGICDVTMSIIYGEGQESARRRLLREIAAKDQPLDDLVPSLARRCISLPFCAVSNYTERLLLSRELEDQIGRPYPTSALAHAVIVCGLGGTGKTQLVLHHIDAHQQEYDTILWLDARTEHTVRSSFQRCCLALHLGTATSTSQGPLKDAPDMQRLLHWLSARKKEQRWLVVVDNADDLSWGMGELIPQGQAGSVIITSRDSNASQMLGGKIGKVKVDAMTDAEAASLVLNSVEDNYRSAETERLAGLVASALDNIALAVGLAAARIATDVEDGHDLSDSLRRYLDDLVRHQGELLQDDEYARCSTYTQTVWTVWETSVKSLRSNKTFGSFELLGLLAMLDGTNIQDELFRIASSGFETACDGLQVQSPAWLQRILRTSENESWDDFHYRAALTPLLRYGLARRSNSSLPGVTMHSLVQWRIKQHIPDQERWLSFSIVIGAVCHVSMTGKLSNLTVSYPALLAHVPSNAQLLRQPHARCDMFVTWLWQTVASAWRERRNLSIPEELLEAALDRSSNLLGRKHYETLLSMTQLAWVFSAQGRSRAAEHLLVEVAKVYASSRESDENFMYALDREDLLYTLGLIAGIYLDQQRWNEAERLLTSVINKGSRVLGEMHKATLQSQSLLMDVYAKQGRSQEAEALCSRLIKATSRVLGEKHDRSLQFLRKLADLYQAQEKYEDELKIRLKVLAGYDGLIDNSHGSEVEALWDLATTYRLLEDYDKALEMFLKIEDIFTRLFGAGSQLTIHARVTLADVYFDAGQFQEAERIWLSVENQCAQLGTEDSIVTLASGLADVYEMQGRHEEAEAKRKQAEESRARNTTREEGDFPPVILDLDALDLDQDELPESSRRKPSEMLSDEQLDEGSVRSRDEDANEPSSPARPKTRKRKAKQGEKARGKRPKPS